MSASRAAPPRTLELYEVIVYFIYHLKKMNFLFKWLLCNINFTYDINKNYIKQQIWSKQDVEIILFKVMNYFLSNFEKSFINHTFEKKECL